MANVDTMASDQLLVPVQLQAFVLNPAVCNTGADDDQGARIMPMCQPNYTFLRLDNFLVQSDVLRHADLHNAAPADVNPRLTDLGAPGRPQTRRNRCGVYLHWILPRLYRSGLASSDSVSASKHEEERLRRGLPRRPQPSSADAGSPEFRQPPTRWLVMRRLDLDSIEPPSARPSLGEYQAWVVESDYRWKLDDIPLDYDLQVDVSPFVVGVAGDQDGIEQQAEVFIGRKTPLEEWAPSPGAQYADITLLRSSNQLFADFQLHNSNVFSILDNFEYRDASDPDQPLYLQRARASYYLVGWHSTTALDPLGSKTEITRAAKLDALSMAIQGKPPSAAAWLASTDPASLCLHGALYDVGWDMESKPPLVPADGFAATLQQQLVPSVSVGTTPMDSLITYCRARHAHDGAIARLEEDILAIDSLLHARDDGVEGQREAKDSVYNWNFSRAQGGTHYYLGGQDSSGRPTQPSQAAIDGLRQLNQLQLLLDSCRRAATQYRWDMFASWWKYVSDVAKKQRDDSVDDSFKVVVDDIAERLQGLDLRIAGLASAVQQQLADPALAIAKTGTLSFYYRSRDPTVLIGGIESGWPPDFSDDVRARLPLQVVEPTGPLPSALGQLMQTIHARNLFLNTGQLGAFDKLCAEFFALDPDNNPPQTPPDGQCHPQFHDQTAAPDGSMLWRDVWENRQPWFPLYAEWELEYTHVPFGSWSLDEQAARLSDAKLVRYGIPPKDGTPLWEELKTDDPGVPQDVRILSGRVLVLPQPSFSLAAKVKQLFQDTPPAILDQYLAQQDRQDLLDNITKLSYLSFPLTGLTNGLLTLSQGTHIKPENKESVDGKPPTLSALTAAEFPRAGFDKTNIERILGNSALTPYATMVNFSSPTFCPFKPVTHGQFRFRKLNIIDKFGQVLAAIDQKPRPDGPPPLYPCISDFYEPQVVQLAGGAAAANTVRQNSGENCEYMQLPPVINQNARLNANFVVRAPTGGAAYWRPATEWENPIWGWLVVNYADSGIQLFLRDGSFYREVRVGSPDGAVASPKWLPFAPSKLPAAADTAQLDALVDKLQDSDYLAAFWNMVADALDNMAPSPSSYAQFLSSIVGKPLALVNMGWSLELDGPALKNQSTSSTVVDPVPHLLPQTPDDQESYSFRIKFGDKLREYDGLVGYFDANPKPTGLQDELLLDHIKTYFTGKDRSKDTLVPIAADTYPAFKPFWVPPFPEKAPYDKPVDPGSYEDQRNSEMHVYGAIVDPFTPIHAYSSILPAQALQLPSWTWQDAIQAITAFFHAGPLHVTGDVKDYDSSGKLTSDNMKDRPANNVELPALSAGDWNWLQPYVDADPTDELPVFNAYGIEQKGNLVSPGFQKGPYTALEGFLQLRRPIMVRNPREND